jgi:hypothetical protein
LAAEVAALTGMVVTGPVLDAVGGSPDFLLFHGAGRAEILLLVVAYTLLPPLLLITPGALVGIGLGPRARRAAHLATLVLLVGVLAVQVGGHLIPGTPALVVPVAAVVVIASGYAYHRWSVPGRLLRAAAVGPLACVLLFVFASPTSAILLPNRAAASPGAATRTPGAAPPPVVLLVLDEFPLVSLLDDTGEIDAVRYPNFARLAAGSTWYRNATGVSGWTPYALPAMLTGRYPERDRAPHYAAYPENLFTLLDPVYDIRAQETISELCPPWVCGARTGSVPRGGLPELLRGGIRVWVDTLRPGGDPGQAAQESYREVTRAEVDSEPAPTDPTFRWGALDENQPARFTEFLAGLGPSPLPTLHFLHLLLPHSPWHYLASGVRYDLPEPGLPHDGDGWVELAHQRHLAQVAYTDRLLGETLRRLTETGLYDEALFIVTADHGVSFTPGEQGRGLGAVRCAPAEVLWVPTFIKEPGQRSGRVDDRNWEQIDLLPTVADLVGQAVPWSIDGRSARAEPRSTGDKRFHDRPGEALTVPGAEVFGALRDGIARPAPVPAPWPELLGRELAALPVHDDGPPVTVAVPVQFDLAPGAATLPALVYGAVPPAVPTGSYLAVAVNGRIATVTRVLDPDPQGRRFAAFLPDESLFKFGTNRLEIVQVASDGSLRRTTPVFGS